MTLIGSFEDTESYDLLANGSIITYKQNPLIIKIASMEGDPYTLYLRVFFENDPKKDYQETRLEIDGEYLNLILINYNGPVAKGNDSPIRVGIAGTSKENIDTEIYLNFKVIGSEGSGDKLFFYTLYGVPKEVKTTKKSSPRKRKDTKA